VFITVVIAVIVATVIIIIVVNVIIIIVVTVIIFIVTASIIAAVRADAKQRAKQLQIARRLATGFTAFAGRQCSTGLLQRATF
jgi:hypothetical protein